MRTCAPQEGASPFKLESITINHARLASAILLRALKMRQQGQRSEMTPGLRTRGAGCKRRAQDAASGEQMTAGQSHVGRKVLKEDFPQRGAWSRASTRLRQPSQAQFSSELSYYRGLASRARTAARLSDQCGARSCSRQVAQGTAGSSAAHGHASVCAIAAFTTPMHSRARIGAGAAWRVSQAAKIVEPCRRSTDFEEPEGGSRPLARSSGAQGNRTATSPS